uniref:Tetraspanin 8 n=1 Tax=Strigops habroptila TaxID=2489341 RepID=A0A672TM69_STRHB
MAGVSSCMKYSMFIFNFLFWELPLVAERFFPLSFQELEIDSSVFAGVDLLIAVGSIIMILGFLGCCGAIKESRCMLLLFFIGLLLILILQVTGGILVAVYRSQVQYYSAFSLMSSQSFISTPKLIKYLDLQIETYLEKSLQESCCGLLNGPSDWGKNIGNKICECELKSSSDLCTYYQGRYVYKTVRKYRFPLFFPQRGFNPALSLVTGIVSSSVSFQNGKVLLSLH